MQRLAYALAAVLLASAFTGCALFNRGGDNPQESYDRPGWRADNPASRFFEVVVVPDNVFTPAEAWVRENTSVAFTNGAYGMHSAVGQKGEFNTGGITPQSSVPVFFDVKGDYAYVCGSHPNMKGVIHVV